MTTIAAGRSSERGVEQYLRVGTWIMGAAAVGFIGYAVLFLVRNFTDSFLELGVYTAARDAYLVLSVTAQEEYGVR